MLEKIGLWLGLFLLVGGQVAARDNPVPSQPTQVRLRSPALKAHRISLVNGKTFNLNLAEGFAIKVAAQGLKRVRFMAKSPDGRLFLTDMFDLTDNRKGKVYILSGFDPQKGQFRTVTTYLSQLRNPNSIAFYTDKDGVQWLYLALTDRLLRYRYTSGENAPSNPPQVLATFPDYGLSYKYGGWHLTRTVTIGPDEKVYVSVGSSCNACEEKEAIRATILTMDPDGANPHTFARGLRNAVGLKWVGSQLYATDMGADHLGDDKPEDRLYTIADQKNYGWPYCYEYNSRVYTDPKFNHTGSKFNCAQVPSAYAAFPAHSAALGLEYFDASHTPELSKAFLVALHGSGKRRLGRGYALVRVQKGLPVQEFINGFWQNGTVYGRPADVLSIGTDQFLFTDDHAGVVYYVFKQT
ncbi:MAG: PQQ-dependent sugar dehydrogenase [Gemmatimonadaceae bacterium]|nr:PQQ-dependent sugar dehydrogenase [Gloeobacterales cyanobacterium ES-bin-141]